MPLKQGITMEEVIKAICRECCSPPYEYENETSNDAARSVSNAGYMILHNMGFTHEEIVPMYDEAQKIKFAKIIKKAALGNKLRGWRM
jgi:hypothetical protein